MMVGNEEFVPENLIHNLFFLRAEKTRQHSFKREKNVRSASKFFLPQSLFLRVLLFQQPQQNKFCKHTLRASKKRETRFDLFKQTRREVQKGHIFTNPKFFKSEEGERKKKQNSSKHFARVFLSRRRGKTRTLKTHAQNALLRKGDDDDEGRV